MVRPRFSLVGADWTVFSLLYCALCDVLLFELVDKLTEQIVLISFAVAVVHIKCFPIFVLCIICCRIVWPEFYSKQEEKICSNFIFREIGCTVFSVCVLAIRQFFDRFISDLANFWLFCVCGENGPSLWNILKSCREMLEIQHNWHCDYI